MSAFVCQPPPPILARRTTGNRHTLELEGVWLNTALVNCVLLLILDPHNRKLKVFFLIKSIGLLVLFFALINAFLFNFMITLV